MKEKTTRVDESQRTASFPSTPEAQPRNAAKSPAAESYDAPESTEIDAYGAVLPAHQDRAARRFSVLLFLFGVCVIGAAIAAFTETPQGYLIMGFPLAAFGLTLAAVLLLTHGRD